MGRNSEDTANGTQGELARLRSALDSINDGFQIIGFDWRYLYVNASTAKHGRRSPEALVGRTMMESYPGIEESAMFKTLERCMRERARETMENQFAYDDGSQAWFELRIEPCVEGISVLSVDITERKKMEAQLVQAQKMEAVGRLAGGIAHDFNNLLSIILSYSQMLLSDKSLDPQALSDIEEIRTAGVRGADLTKQLLAFSRQQVVEPRVVDLNEVIASLGVMIRRVVGEDVTVTVVPRADLGRVNADPGHIEQVIMNLVINARDAMPTGGVLTIETGNIMFDEAYARAHMGARTGPHVMLAISDTGQGMDKVMQERIFEPFFTTKEKAKGTGLGLSTVYGIIKQANGNIWVYSEIGRGTTFKIFLPQSSESESTTVPHAPTFTVSGGSETILLVEDDEQVRLLATAILRKHGYHVLAADGGEQALRLCAERQGEIHLLLTDVVMPVMSGKQVADRVLALRPGLAVLFMSGYTEDAIVHHRVLEPGVALLQKPLTPERLLQKVRQMIDA